MRACACERPVRSGQGSGLEGRASCLARMRGIIGMVGFAPSVELAACVVAAHPPPVVVGRQVGTPHSLHGRIRMATNECGAASKIDLITLTARDRCE